MTPAAVDGTSIVALSVSSVISGASTSMRSPGFTITSITSTSLKLPRSGTRTSVRAAASFIAWSPSGLPRHRLAGIDAERLDRLVHGIDVHASLISQRFERRDCDVVAIHLEEPAQGGARVGAAVAVGAECHVATGDPLP